MKWIIIILKYIKSIDSNFMNYAKTVNEIKPSYTVMDFEMLHILKIKASTICNRKERPIEN